MNPASPPPPEPPAAPPPLPFEFTVLGPPVSHQTNDRPALAAWKATVRAAATARWGSHPPVAVRLRISLTYLHDGASARIDLDNVLKPVQDALNALVYADDDLITDVLLRKAAIDDPIRARHASRVLLDAYAEGKPFLHVIINHAPPHDAPLT